MAGVRINVQTTPGSVPYCFFSLRFAVENGIIDNGKIGNGGGSVYAQVIVDIVHENVAHTFTYAVPQGMALSVGQRVEVSFGPRRKEGVVISLSETYTGDFQRCAVVVCMKRLRPWYSWRFDAVNCRLP